MSYFLSAESLKKNIFNRYNEMLKDDRMNNRNSTLVCNLFFHWIELGKDFRGSKNPFWHDTVVIDGKFYLFLNWECFADFVGFFFTQQCVVRW